LVTDDINQTAGLNEYDCILMKNNN